MSENFSVSFESPQSGWMSVRLRAGSEQLLLGVSHAPYDSLRDLVEGLAALASERRPCVVRWNCEPEEYDFDLKATEGDRARLRVTRYPDHRREPRASRTVFSLDAPLHQIVLSFWRELRGLLSRGVEDEFEKNWRRRFPERELQRLTETVAPFVQAEASER